MRSIISSTLLMTTVLVSGILLSSGCRKKKDTIAKIYVRDAANELVSGATVVLKGVSSEPGKQALVDLYDTTETNSSGEAIFNFNDVYQLGQAGVAVLNIVAEKNGLKGQGIIKVEEEVTSEETVFIQP